MTARGKFRKLYHFLVALLLVFPLVLSSFSTTSATGDPPQSSLETTDLQTIAKPYSPVDPQAQAALNAAKASLEGHPLLSNPPVFTTIIPSSSWVNRNPTNPLPGRAGHAMAYAAAAGKVILFGGRNGSSYFNDTWAYDYAANTWVSRNPTNSPPGRESPALAYDASAGKVILFGGRIGSSGFLNDTWAYDYAANTWSNRSPATPLPARCGHVLAYDASAGKVILFGGSNNSGFLNDTWAYDYAANTWSNRNPAFPPPARDNHTIAYDSQSEKVILFGGSNNSGYRNDTWAYDYASNSWTNRNPANPPPARGTHALAYDAAAGKVILFGGYGGDTLNDTWAYDYAANSWVNRSPANPPPVRYYHALAYAAAGKVILFGGWNDSGNLSDTWAYDYASNSWTNRNPANPLPGRVGHAMAYDASAGKVILFGGFGGNTLNDTWAYDWAANTWSDRNPANPPPVRYAHALAYAASAGKVILFGGRNGSDYLNDTWAYDYASNSWTNRNPANPPPARGTHALAYDASAGKVVLFGGAGNSGWLNDTWAYDYAANSWVNRNPANPPPVRYYHALAYTSAGKVILFGGWNDSGNLSDTWAYDYASNSWTNRNPSNPPPARSGHAMVYDASAGKVILFGGFGGNYLNDTWAYDWAANTWSDRNPANPPPVRYAHALVYDASAGKVILFGGYNGSGSEGRLNDTWAYDYSGSDSVTYTLQEKWNMISLPLIPASLDPLVVFGGLPSPWYLFEWDPLAGIYIGKESINLYLGVGYWLKVPTAVDYPVSGLPNGEAQTGINLGLNWNLIGVPYQGTIPWGAVRISRYGGALVTLDDAIASSWIQGMFFHWNGSMYDVLTSGGSFQSLLGYWLKAKVTGLRLVFLKP